MKQFSFSIEKELPNGLGRVGIMRTAHGKVKTPAFVAVATKGTVKSLTPEQVIDTGVQVAIANTYHLYIEPGSEKIKNLGGLHNVMNWPGPLMTDSGGFQVFSLGVAYGKGLSKILKKNEPLLVNSAHQYFHIGCGNIGQDGEGSKIVKIDPDGVMFRSHSNGDAHYFTPEKSIDIQHNLGADIIFAFDECTSPHESLHYQKEALDRTHRWAKRSLDHHLEKSRLRLSSGQPGQAIFGIVQGGRDENLRKESAKTIGSMGFDGFGIGGSFEKEDMDKAVEWCNLILPKEKPRHLLGIGEPVDLFGAVEKGSDLFDCVSPTRLGRNGTIYTEFGQISLLKEQFKDDSKPLDANCLCYSCRNYSRAYIAHLFRAHEMLSATLASIHNLYFITNMVNKMRETMISDYFHNYKRDFLKKYLSAH